MAALISFVSELIKLPSLDKYFSMTFLVAGCDIAVFLLNPLAEIL